MARVRIGAGSRPATSDATSDPGRSTPEVDLELRDRREVGVAAGLPDDPHAVSPGGREPEGVRRGVTRAGAVGIVRADGEPVDVDPTEVLPHLHAQPTVVRREPAA